MNSSLLEFLFPRFCVGCGYVGVYLCPPCQKKIMKIKKQACVYCGRPSLYGLTHKQCSKEGGIDGHLSLYKYDGLFKTVLQKAKYSGALLVLRALLLFSDPTLSKQISMWQKLFDPVVTSVPLHPNRMRQRGFNQSDMIVKELFHSFKEGGGILARKKDTAHLAGMDERNTRKKHIQGAFVYSKETVPQSVLLVDDVLTTGSTMMECVGELKRRGVRIVLAFSLANG